MGYLYQKTEQGGLDMIDIKARNQEIIGMKLKTYLTKNPHPT
jgi:hypothetical protein